MVTYSGPNLLHRSKAELLVYLIYFRLTDDFCKGYYAALITIIAHDPSVGWHCCQIHGANKHDPKPMHFRLLSSTSHVFAVATTELATLDLILIAWQIATLGSLPTW